MQKEVIDLLRPDVSPEAKLTGISLFFAKWNEKLNRRVVDLESRQLQKGDKGDKGDTGSTGPQGKVGPMGLQGKQGLNGSDGIDGKQGPQGEQGISVVDAEIAADGNFIFKLSNGQEIDAGSPIDMKTKGVQINTQLANYQVTVSATAPASPQVGDLWYDLS